MKIHPLSDVSSSKIGKGTTIWQFSVVLSGAQIGEDCNLCAHTFVENDVVLGDRVTVKNGVYLWDGIVLEDDVFIALALHLRMTSSRAQNSTQSRFQKFKFRKAHLSVLMQLYCRVLPLDKMQW